MESVGPTASRSLPTPHSPPPGARSGTPTRGTASRRGRGVRGGRTEPARGADGIPTLSSAAATSRRALSDPLTSAPSVPRRGQPAGLPRRRRRPPGGPGSGPRDCASGRRLQSGCAAAALPAARVPRLERVGRRRRREGAEAEGGGGGGPPGRDAPPGAELPDPAGRDRPPERGLRARRGEETREGVGASPGGG